MTIVQTSAALRLPIDGRHRRMFIGGAWVRCPLGPDHRNPQSSHLGAVIATVPRGDPPGTSSWRWAAARKAFEGPWKPVQAL